MDYTSKGSNIVEFNHEGYHVIAERAKGVITIHTRVVVGPDVSRAMKEYATQCFDDLDSKPNEHSVGDSKSEYPSDPPGADVGNESTTKSDEPSKGSDQPQSESGPTSRGEEDPESEEEFATNVALANAPKKRKKKGK